MFSFLRVVSPTLVARYETLERNLRAGSSSFFDAYLDLLEELLRVEAAAVLPDVSPRASAGDLLRDARLRAHCIALGTDEALCDKLADYVLKINSHKHKREKSLTPEMAVSYLAVLHRFAAVFAARRGVSAPVFVGEYFTSIFGSYEREQRAIGETLIERVDGLADRVDAVAARIESLTAEAAAEETAKRARAEEDEKRARREKTMRLLSGASRSYLYVFSEGVRRRCRILVFVCLALLLATLTLYSVGFSLYATKNAAQLQWFSWVISFVRNCFFIFYVLVAIRTWRARERVSERSVAGVMSVKQGAVGERITMHHLRTYYTVVAVLASFSFLFWAFYGIGCGLAVEPPLALCLLTILLLFLLDYFFSKLFSGYLLIAYHCRDPKTGKSEIVYYDTLQSMYINAQEAARRYPLAVPSPAVTENQDQ